MNAAYRFTLTAVMTVATLLAPAVGWAQAKKPAVVISIASVDKILGDVGYLTRAAGTPEFGGFVTLMAGPYLQGIDTKRPSGVYLQFAGPQPTGVAFLPVTNLDLVLQQLENNNIEAEDAGDGIKKINTPQRPLYVKESNGWAFISDSEESLANVPADPTQQLGGLNNRYNLAFKINVRSIPEELIDMAVSEMKNGFERNLEAETDEATKELQEKIGRKQIDNFTRLLQESDEIVVGWGVDSKSGKTFLDLGMTAVAGTKLATQMDGYKNLKSNFTGLEHPDAAASLRFTMTIPQEDIEQATEGLKVLEEQALAAVEEDDNLQDEATMEAAKQIVTSLFAVVTATVESGKLDGGLAVVLDETSLNVVTGGFVADGNVVQAQLKKLVKLAEEAGDDDVAIEDLEFNAEKHKGVDLHTFSIPIPEDEEDTQAVFGEQLDVVIGTGKQSAFLSFGDDSMDLLKGIIDASATGAQKEIVPFQLVVSMAPILEFAAAMDEEDEMLSTLAEAAGKAAGKDHVRITQKAVERGTFVRLEVEEGVLQLIGAAAKAQNERNE